MVQLDGNTATLASGEKTILSEKDKALLEKNMKQAPVEPQEPIQEQQPVQAPVEAPVKQIEAPKAPEPVATKPIEVKTEVKPTEIQADKIAQEQKTLEKFRNLMQSGAKQQELTQFVDQNKDLRAELGVAFKNFYKDAQTFKFQQKYATATPESLYSDVTNGNIVVGSKQWNTLPESTRQAYTQYADAQSLNMNRTEYKSNLASYFANTQQNVLSFDSYLEGFQGFFGTDIKTQYEELTNAPEISAARTELTGLAENIKNLEDEYDAIEEDYVEKYKGNSQGYIDAKIKAAQKEKEREIKKLQNSYNTKLGAYSDMKADIDRDINFLQYENAQKQQAYQMALSQYNTDRARMDNFAIMEFQEQSKMLAEQRARDFQIEMTRMNQEYEAQNQKPIYELGRDGSLYAIVGGQATPVKSDLGVVMFGEEGDNYQTQLYKNDDGTFTEIKTYSDGRATNVSTYDVDGNKIVGAPDQLQSIIDQCRVDGQCGQGVNDYLQKIGIGRLMGDSYESKSQHINSNTPQVGGVAIWNPQQGQGKYSEYGHVGIVTGYNPMTQKVTITDWNWNGDEKQQTHEVNLSEITYNGGFYNPIPQAEYNESDIPLYKKYNQGKLTSTEYKQIDDLEEFKKQALDYGKEIAKPGYKKIENIINLAESLKGLNPLQRKFPDNASDIKRLLSKAGMQELIDLKAGGATFGQLTEKEFERIQDSIINIGALASAEKWDEYLTEYVDTLKMGLPEDYQWSTQTQQTITTPQASIGGVSLLNSYKNSFNISEYDSILNR